MSSLDCRFNLERAVILIVLRHIWSSWTEHHDQYPDL
jgi:hypothetical protein